jgi:hypothetical protein
MNEIFYYYQNVTDTHGREYQFVLRGSNLPEFEWQKGQQVIFRCENSDLIRTAKQYKPLDQNKAEYDYYYQENYEGYSNKWYYCVRDFILH